MLLFVADLMAEVRSAFPEVEAAGGQRVDVETLALMMPAVAREAGLGTVPVWGRCCP